MDLRTSLVRRGGHRELREESPCFLSPCPAVGGPRPSQEAVSQAVSNYGQSLVLLASSMTSFLICPPFSFTLIFFWFA